MLVLSGGEGYIDFRVGKFNMLWKTIFKVFFVFLLSVFVFLRFTLEMLYLSQSANWSKQMRFQF